MDVSETDRRAVAARLEAAGCIAAGEESAEILAAAPDPETVERWVRRRENGEPLEWVVGTSLFCGHRIRVDQGVFVPRRQSEELARRAAAVLPAGGAAVELCAGAGAIAVHLRSAVPDAMVIAVDCDLAAVRCARANGAVAVISDLGGSLRSGRFDVVVAVAPYVPTTELDYLPADVRRYEPLLALDGGSDGLDVVRRVIATAARLLRPRGWVLLEIGGDQEDSATTTLATHGFETVGTWNDTDGHLRGIAAQAT